MEQIINSTLTENLKITRHTEWQISPIHPNQIVGNPGTGLIATVCENRMGEWEANAKLIASAPELLIEMMNFCENVIVDKKLFENQIAYFRARFRIVIEKATVTVEENLPIESYEQRVNKMVAAGQLTLTLFDKDDENYESGFAAWLLEKYEYTNHTTYCRIYLTKPTTK